MRSPKVSFMMGARTLIQEETVLAETAATTTKETMSKKPVAVHEVDIRGDSYVSPPLVTRSAVLITGFIIFVLATIWPPLLLVVTYLASLIIPYAFRTNDDASMRRHLLQKFEQEDEVSAHLREIPEDVCLKTNYWTNQRGLLLHTSIMTPINQPVKAVVYYCHGYSDNPSYTKRKDLTYIVQHGIALVMIEYEGHGRSDGTLGLITDWDVMVNDVNAYFQEVSETVFPGKKFFLMGESMGGAVAYSIIKAHPDLYSGVVFVCPMCKIADNMLPPQWIIDLFKKLAGPTGSTTLFGFLPISPARGDMKLLTFKLAHKRALFTRCPYVFGRNPRLSTAREMLDITRRISSSLSEFDAPFLVQHGKEDKVTDPKLSQALYDESKSKDKTIHLYEGMWHSLTGGEPLENVLLVFNDAIEWILARADDKVKKQK